MPPAATATGHIHDLRYAAFSECGVLPWRFSSYAEVRTAIRTRISREYSYLKSHAIESSIAELFGARSLAAKTTANLPSGMHRYEDNTILDALADVVSRRKSFAVNILEAGAGRTWEIQKDVGAPWLARAIQRGIPEASILVSDLYANRYPPRLIAVDQVGTLINTDGVDEDCIPQAAAEEFEKHGNMPIQPIPLSTLRKVHPKKNFDPCMRYYVRPAFDYQVESMIAPGIRVETGTGYLSTVSDDNGGTYPQQHLCERLTGQTFDLIFARYQEPSEQETEIHAGIDRLRSILRPGGKILLFFGCGQAAWGWDENHQVRIARPEWS